MKTTRTERDKDRAQKMAEARYGLGAAVSEDELATNHFDFTVWDRTGAKRLAISVADQPLGRARRIFLSRLASIVAAVFLVGCGELDAPAAAEPDASADVAPPPVDAPPPPIVDASADVAAADADAAPADECAPTIGSITTCAQHDGGRSALVSRCDDAGADCTRYDTPDGLSVWCCPK